MAITRSKIYVPIHFVWATHNRLPLLASAFEQRVYDYIARVCQDDGCQVLAVNGMPDHVHLLVGFTATITLGKLMKDVKGGSSRFISEQCLSGEWFAWQAHYSALAVSPSHVTRATAYIRQQKQHHAAGTLWPDAEQTFTDLAETDESDLEQQEPPSAD
jgi:putative transposase